MSADLCSDRMKKKLTNCWCIRKKKINMCIRKKKMEIMKMEERRDNVVTNIIN